MDSGTFILVMYWVGAVNIVLVTFIFIMMVIKRRYEKRLTEAWRGVGECNSELQDAYECGVERTVVSLEDDHE